MTLGRAAHPFQFVTQAGLTELTGLKARDLRELVQHLKTVPKSVIYHHTHHFLKQHHFLSPEPPNDFAYWVTNVLQEDRLGEQLAAINTIRIPSIRELRERTLATMEQYLKDHPTTRVAPPGEEFHFERSITFVIPTPYLVYDLQEFFEAVRKVSVHSLYHHMFEARLRLERGTNDFSNWLEHELNEQSVAKAIARLDPYTQTLEGLRLRIVWLVEGRLRVVLREGSHVA